MYSVKTLTKFSEAINSKPVHCLCFSFSIKSKRSGSCSRRDICPGMEVGMDIVQKGDWQARREAEQEEQQCFFTSYSQAATTVRMFFHRTKERLAPARTMQWEGNIQWERD